MTLIRHYRPSTRIDHDDLRGLMNVLKDRIEESQANGELMTALYYGAYLSASIFLHHEFVETQDDFMRLFEKYAREAIEDDESED